MKNIQYITTCDNEKQAVILPLNNFNRMEVFLVNQLSLSLLDITFEYLNISEKVIKFLKLLVKCSKSINEIENENFEVTLFDDEIAKQVSEKKTIKAKKKDIQKRRNEDLILIKKAVVDILGETREAGVTYRLNFLKVILKSTREFLGQSPFDLVEIMELTNFAQKTNYSEIEISNHKFKDLVKVLEKNLNILPEEMINERSEQVIKSQKHHKNRNRTDVLCFS